MVRNRHRSCWIHRRSICELVGRTFPQTLPLMKSIHIITGLVFVLSQLFILSFFPWPIVSRYGQYRSSNLSPISNSDYSFHWFSLFSVSRFWDLALGNNHNPISTLHFSLYDKDSEPDLPWNLCVRIVDVLLFSLYSLLLSRVNNLSKSTVHEMYNKSRVELEPYYRIKGGKMCTPLVPSLFKSFNGFQWVGYSSSYSWLRSRYW